MARCTGERLRRSTGPQSVRRGKKFVTTIPDSMPAWPADLVGRNSTADAPNRRWVAGLANVPTWSGVVFTAFVFNVISRGIELKCRRQPPSGERDAGTP